MITYKQTHSYLRCRCHYKHANTGTNRHGCWKYQSCVSPALSPWPPRGLMVRVKLSWRRGERPLFLWVGCLAMCLDLTGRENTGKKTHLLFSWDTKRPHRSELEEEEEDDRMGNDGEWKAASGLTLNSLCSPRHLWPPLSDWNLKAWLLINLLASISRAGMHRPPPTVNWSRDNRAKLPLMTTSQIKQGSSDTTGVKLFLQMLLTERGRPRVGTRSQLLKVTVYRNWIFFCALLWPLKLYFHWTRNL